MHFIEVAVPVPLRRTFHYISDQPVARGCRVLVKFANRELVGLVCNEVTEADIAEEILPKLAAVKEILDCEPVVNEHWLALLSWLAQYYQAPLGEVVHTALPAVLRKGAPSTYTKPEEIALHPDIADIPFSDAAAHVAVMQLQKKAKKQYAALATLHKALSHGQHLTLSSAHKLTNAASVKALLDKELVQKQPGVIHSGAWLTALLATESTHLSPNVEQSIAITGISSQLNQFFCALIEGVTGSGKTEVYLQIIEKVLRQGQQVLILVPEIGLTPQTVARFAKRFGIEVGVLHSGLNDNERMQVWQKARHNELGLVIGTRSAIFTPFAHLGMIIIDEEHDDSFKQQDGLRYHARDLAIMLARKLAIPVLLGTATPSLESLYNAKQERYQHYVLTNRAGSAVMAQQALINITQQQVEYGLTNEALTLMKEHLQQGNQVLVFMNRRGFAPAVVCQSCGDVHTCQACDKAYTYHQFNRSVQCHQCLHTQPMPRQCSACGGRDILTEGIGTEQLTTGLQQLFPAYSTIRIDSDSMRGKQTLAKTLDAINNLEHQILVGTQILAKGHHFAHVTCVIILDVDGALFSADFRAPEKLAQLVTQISGRAGRAEKPGVTYLQTAQPGHPLLQDLINNGYQHFAEFALHERKALNQPPYSFQALLRAEDQDIRKIMTFLQTMLGFVGHMQHLNVAGPVPCLIEKKQNRYRYCVVLQSTNRSYLQKVLGLLMPECEAKANELRIRWSIDVDNIDFS
ncbi:primosomal protein N' [Opacimonas viscosa]|uniref:Replication restart protein PriA n=1 Tax=Opacimonas viscosa TaxID=2961944 RepID=A0AA42BLR4_9ALTE|nr:primosomal protein N' [Opacimonas viscosa]MCP3429143.1 primosomal protein N' [Opacimonas viscosa]